MTEGRRIRAFDYVNHPYAEVSSALWSDAPRIFKAATTAATSRAENLVSELHIDVAGVKLGADVAIRVKDVTELEAGAAGTPSAILHLEWEAARLPRLFPFMQAELAIYPITGTETQLDFSGVYVPPFGILGTAVNAVVGHRIAEGSVHRFVTEVASYLRATLTPA